MSDFQQDYVEHVNHFLDQAAKELAIPTLGSVDEFEDLADRRDVATLPCLMPAPLALVLYHRDPQMVADWFTWTEQIANG
jgi:hypothetical protein